MGLMLILAPVTAYAGQISFVVEGTVNFISPQLSTVFTIGDNYRLEYTFESTTPDSNPGNPNRGFYDGSISSVTVNVGSYVASPTFTFSRITADNDLGFGVGDRYRIDLTGVSGPGVGGFVLGSQTPVMQMRDPTAAALTSIALPVAPLDPLDFVSGGTFLGLQFDDPVLEDEVYILSASIDSFGFALVDSDGDGVNDDDDFCPGTAIPEGVPTVQLRPNRWALIDGDFEFDTVIKGKGKGPNRSYLVADTAGCSCEQIIEMQGLGNGHTYHGCSISAMDDWKLLVNP